MATVQERQPAWVAYSPCRVSVIVPALNEAENLRYVLPKIPSWVYEVILVDGHSTDGTPERAREILPTVRIVTQEGRGKGAAIRKGVEVAEGDIIVHLDADGSTDPSEIPLFVGALLSGADYAKGSRFAVGAGSYDLTLVHRLGNRALTVVANILFGTKFSDITYGYNAFWRQHSRFLALELDNWSQEIVTNIRVARSRLRVAEVPCYEHGRINGQGKLRAFSAGWMILRGILAERFRKPEYAREAPWQQRLRNEIASTDQAAMLTWSGPDQTAGRLRERLHYRNALLTCPEAIEETRRHPRSYGACAREHYRRTASQREPHSAGELARYLVQGMN
jgi:glycosyltransferase involved in cell wall biosynthesis